MISYIEASLRALVGFPHDRHATPGDREGPPGRDGEAPPLGGARRSPGPSAHRSPETVRTRRRLEAPCSQQRGWPLRSSSGPRTRTCSFKPETSPRFVPRRPAHIGKSPRTSPRFSRSTSTTRRRRPATTTIRASTDKTCARGVSPTSSPAMRGTQRRERCGSRRISGGATGDSARSRSSASRT